MAYSIDRYDKMPVKAPVYNKVDKRSKDDEEAPVKKSSSATPPPPSVPNAPRSDAASKLEAVNSRFTFNGVNPDRPWDARASENYFGGYAPPLYQLFSNFTGSKAVQDPYKLPGSGASYSISNTTVPTTGAPGQISNKPHAPEWINQSTGGKKKNDSDFTWPGSQAGPATKAPAANNTQSGNNTPASGNNSNVGEIIAKQKRGEGLTLEEIRSLYSNQAGIQEGGRGYEWGNNLPVSMKTQFGYPYAASWGMNANGSYPGKAYYPYNMTDRSYNIGAGMPKVSGYYIAPDGKYYQINTALAAQQIKSMYANGYSGSGDYNGYIYPDSGRSYGSGGGGYGGGGSWGGGGGGSSNYNSNYADDWYNALTNWRI